MPYPELARRGVARADRYASRMRTLLRALLPLAFSTVAGCGAVTPAAVAPIDASASPASVEAACSRYTVAESIWNAEELQSLMVADEACRRARGGPEAVRDGARERSIHVLEVAYARTHERAVLAALETLRADATRRK